MAFPEDLDHLFIRCSTAREVGALLKRWWPDWPYNVDSVVALWDGTQSAQSNNRIKKVGEVIGLAFFWELWKQRNEKIHSGMMRNGIGIVNSIQAQALIWLKIRSRFGKTICWDDWIKSPMDSVCNFPL